MLSQWARSSRQDLPEFWEWSGVPKEGQRGRESLPEGQEWSKGSPGGPEVVGRPFRRA